MWSNFLGKESIFKDSQTLSVNINNNCNNPTANNISQRDDWYQRKAEFLSIFTGSQYMKASRYPIVVTETHVKSLHTLRHLTRQNAKVLKSFQGCEWHRERSLDGKSESVRIDELMR